MAKKMLTALNTTIHHFVPSCAYSIGKRREDNICLVNEDGKWIVTIVERGQDDVRSSSSSLFVECLDFIRNAVEKSSVQEAMDIFGNELIKN